MNLFDRVIVQPLFNILLGIYALVGDLGIAIIIFGVLVRLALWPLMRRQLHQSKKMQVLAPELKKIKVKAKGNRALESQMMMELYKERGVKPFNSILMTVIQLPILLALFTALKTLTQNRDQIRAYTYPFLDHVTRIKDILANPHHFNERLFGTIDLSQTAHQAWFIAALALLTALLQYFQSRQILPKADSSRRLRDILREQSSGNNNVDASEMNAVLGRRLIVVMPFLVLIFMINLPGALVLYYAIQSLTAIVLQRYFLNKDSEEMIESVETPAPAGKKATAKARAKAAREAVVVEGKK